jgi:ACS family glucarate transporter-like MFS transporter
MTHVRYRILALLFGVSFVNYLLRNNLSIVLPSIRAEFEFSNEQIGWILASFNIAYTVFQVPGGIFGDRVGPRRAFLFLAIAWGLITAATGFVPALMGASAAAVLVGLMVARALMGVTDAPMFPVAAGTIANWFPPGHWAFPNAMLSSGLALGQAATGPVVTTLITFFGWRGSFLSLAPLGFAIALAWWFGARDAPQEHRATDEAERAFIRHGRALLPQAAPALAWHQVLLKRDVLLLAASYFCMNFVFLMFSQWLFQYLVEERGFSLLEGGLMYAAPFVVGAVFASVGGLTCDFLCRQIGPRWGCRLPAIAALLMVAWLLLAGARAPDPYVAVALLSLCFGFTQFTEGIYWSAATYASEPHTAMATGVLNTGGNITGFLAPAVGILLDRFGWMTTFAAGSAFAIMAALLWLTVSLAPRVRAATIPA